MILIDQNQTKKRSHFRGNANSLFAALTMKPPNEHEKKRLKTKSELLVRRLKSKASSDERKNELLLRQIIAYLALEFKQVQLEF